MTANNFLSVYLPIIGGGCISDWASPIARSANYGPMPKIYHLPKRGKYKPHQGRKEKARRVRQGLAK